MNISNYNLSLTEISKRERETDSIFDDHMGSSNGKQNGERENNKRRSHFRRIFYTNNTPRPVSYAGIDQDHEEYRTSIRPMSMIDVGPFDNFEMSETIPTETPININPISHGSPPPLITGRQILVPNCFFE